MGGLNKKGRDVVDVLVKELRANGVDDHRVVCNKRGHPRIVFSYDGETRSITVPGTPSDPRSLLNTRAQLRRMMRGDRVPLNGHSR